MSPKRPISQPNGLHGVRACLRDGIAAALRHPVHAFLGMQALVAFAALGSVTPWINVVFLVLVAPQLLGAIPALALGMVGGLPAGGTEDEDTEADETAVPLRTYLSGFRRCERWLGISGVAYLVSIALAWPLALAVWLDLRITPDAVQPWVLGIGGAISAAGWRLVFRPYLFVPFVAADAPREMTMQAVLDRSLGLWWKGRRKIALRGWGLLGMCLSGGLAGGIGTVFTLPVGLLALAVLYRSLSAGADEALK